MDYWEIATCSHQPASGSQVLTVLGDKFICVCLQWCNGSLEAQHQDTLSWFTTKDWHKEWIARCTEGTSVSIFSYKSSQPDMGQWYLLLILGVMWYQVSCLNWQLSYWFTWLVEHLHKDIFECTLAMIPAAGEPKETSYQKSPYLCDCIQHVLNCWTFTCADSIFMAYKHRHSWARMYLDSWYGTHHITDVIGGISSQVLPKLS